ALARLAGEPRREHVELLDLVDKFAGSLPSVEWEVRVGQVRVLVSAAVHAENHLLEQRAAAEQVRVEPPWEILRHVACIRREQPDLVEIRAYAVPGKEDI